jgi:hypothetical protein
MATNPGIGVKEWYKCAANIKSSPEPVLAFRVGDKAYA